MVSQGGSISVDGASAYFGVGSSKAGPRYRVRNCDNYRNSMLLPMPATVY